MRSWCCTSWPVLAEGAAEPSRGRSQAQERFKEDSTSEFAAVARAHPEAERLEVWSGTRRAELGQTVPPGAHAVVLMDRAGWHTARELDLPAKLTPVFLPPIPPS